MKKNVLLLSVAFMVGSAFNLHAEGLEHNFRKGIGYGLVWKPNRWWPKQWLYAPQFLFNREANCIGDDGGVHYTSDGKKNDLSSMLARWAGCGASLALQGAAGYGVYWGGKLLYKKCTSN